MITAASLLSTYRCLDVFDLEDTRIRSHACFREQLPSSGDCPHRLLSVDFTTRNV